MSETNSPASEITAVELWRRLYEARPAGSWYLLDVRNEDEVKGWRVEGPANVPFVAIPYFAFVDDPDAALARLPRNLGEAVVVCAKGGSSEFVAGLMREAGLPALNLTGGMIAWGDFHVPLRVSGDEDAFQIWQFNRFGKGCLSYVVIAGAEAAIVDPSRFPEQYEAFVKEKGARIVEVLETHVHADHLSGGPVLAQRNGARYRVLSEHGKLPAAGSPLESGARLRLGGANGVNITAQALRTPGHTPESTSYRVGDHYLISGDTLFVKGVGRPDLGGHVEEWGRALFGTLREVIAPLPDDLRILPAHFGSHEEADATGRVVGTLGRLRATSPELKINDPEEFVRAMKAGVREPPAIYAQIVKANLGLVDPGDKAGEWELGKNECAATAAKRRAAAGTA